MRMIKYYKSTLQFQMYKHYINMKGLCNKFSIEKSFNELNVLSHLNHKILIYSFIKRVARCNKLQLSLLFQKYIQAIKSIILIFN